jgi:hypothetical protein
MPGHPGVPEGLRAYAQPRTSTAPSTTTAPAAPKFGEYTCVRIHPLHHSGHLPDSSTTPTGTGPPARLADGTPSRPNSTIAPPTWRSPWPAQDASPSTTTPARAQSADHPEAGSRSLTLLIIRPPGSKHDRPPDNSYLGCHGQPADPLLHLINQAAIGVNDVVICPVEADLGGIRIAARIHDHLPPDTRRVIVDIGAGEHDQGEPFSTLTRDRIATTAERTDAVGVFARSCLARGYAVEQESPARATLQPLL